MLRIQSELQQTQIKQSEEIQQLLEQGREQDRRIQQFSTFFSSMTNDQNRGIDKTPLQSIFIR